VAHDNGAMDRDISTPVGIWTWNTDTATVELNEVYNQHAKSADGGCFDVDFFNRRNTYQYNYGHDCDGYGISIYGALHDVTTDTVIRYNVFANNSRKIKVGALHTACWDGGALDGVQFYNNTIYHNPNTGAVTAALHDYNDAQYPKWNTAWTGTRP